MVGLGWPCPTCFALVFMDAPNDVCCTNGREHGFQRHAISPNLSSFTIYLESRRIFLHMPKICLMQSWKVLFGHNVDQCRCHCFVCYVVTKHRVAKQPCQWKQSSTSEKYRFPWVVQAFFLLTWFALLSAWSLVDLLTYSEIVYDVLLVLG